MPLTIGTQLGSHEIIALLGRGGMGEVYRARDLKLKREVAIKILPEEFSRDTDRVSRFQREAEVLALLNHPNIAGIYDLAEANGSRYLVLELVEGETLADRIARGPIPVEEALHIAKSICEALEVAHEKGIIHRDLKPANIKVTPDGKVKVLDFGLAKAVEQAQQNSSLSNSPTLSMAATNAGVILGTAAYMSPEQAKGRSLDKRTDIFAFGCVLYEMLTGKRAFDGEDASDVLSAVLRADPDWNGLPAALPAPARHLLKLCLEKNPQKRRRDAGDLIIDIEHALERSLEPVSISAQRTSRAAWIAAAGFALTTAALLVPGWHHFSEKPAPETRVEINTPATPQPLHFALSPDGRQVVFVASGDGSQKLWVRPLEAGSSRPLAGTDGAEFPFWSADNRSIGFFASGKLKRVDASGGPSQVIADAAAGRGGTWNAEGTIVFAPSNAGPLFRVAASGGQPVAVTTLASQRGSNRFPQFLPDGDHFLFFTQGTDAQGIYLGSLTRMESHRLTAADTAGAYVNPGWLLFNRMGALMGRRLNLSSGTLEGDPITVAESVNNDLGFNLGGFSASPNGTIAYRGGGLEFRQLTWYDRTGRVLGAVGDPEADILQGPELSPDGRRAAVVRALEDNQDVWIFDLAHGTATRTTFDTAADTYSVWSPDGTQIVFTSNRKGIFDLYVKPSSGAGVEKLLLESSRVKLPGSWSRDGKYVLYANGDPKTGFDLLALPLTGDNKEPIVVVNTPFEEREGQFSPNSHWIAYQSNESGRFEIYVQPFPNAGGKWQISTAGGTAPRWGHDGKELFFISPDGKLMAASIQASGDSIEHGAPAALFQTRIATGGNASLRQEYDVSADGRFLINTVTEASSAPISLILNWRPKQ